MGFAGCLIAWKKEMEKNLPPKHQIEGAIISDNEQWGLCIVCKWWQIEPDAVPEHLTAGDCIEERIQPFQLRVTGNGGCNRFVEGKPARGEGSSEKPPTAKPAR